MGSSRRLSFLFPDFSDIPISPPSFLTIPEEKTNGRRHFLDPEKESRLSDRKASPGSPANGSIMGGEVEDGRDRSSRPESAIYQSQIREYLPDLPGVPERRGSGEVQAGSRKRFAKVGKKIPEADLRRDPEGHLAALCHSERQGQGTCRKQEGQKPRTGFEDSPTGRIFRQEGKTGNDLQASCKIEDRLCFGASLETMYAMEVLWIPGGRDLGQSVGILDRKTRNPGSQQKIPDGAPFRSS